MIFKLYFSIFVTCFNNFDIANGDVNKTTRGMPFFHVVRFPNIDCNSSSGELGTCFTSGECSERNGTSDGSCANGFGVCCMFKKSCDDVSYENNTYFVSNTNDVQEGMCSLKVCKVTPSICQLRIDFITFVINGPVDDPGKSGSVSEKFNSQSVSLATQCQIDRFFVTGSSGGSTPTICGVNSGQHIYVETSSACNSLVFQLGLNGKIPNREWSLKVVQLSSLDSNIAPPGCTQYFLESEGTIQSFNWPNKVQLADQRQNICFRREKGFCRICFHASQPDDFAVSGKEKKGYAKNSKCCGYGKTAREVVGFDCVMIPGAEPVGGNGAMASPSICGNGAGLVSKTGSASVTICSSFTPFQFNFLTDAFTASETVFQGFKLKFKQTSCK